MEFWEPEGSAPSWQLWCSWTPRNGWKQCTEASKTQDLKKASLLEKKFPRLPAGTLGNLKLLTGLHMPNWTNKIEKKDDRI